MTFVQLSTRHVPDEQEPALTTMLFVRKPIWCETPTATEVTPSQPGMGIPLTSALVSKAVPLANTATVEYSPPSTLTTFCHAATLHWLSLVQPMATSVPSGLMASVWR